MLNAFDINQKFNQTSIAGSINFLFYVIQIDYIDNGTTLQTLQLWKLIECKNEILCPFWIKNSDITYDGITQNCIDGVFQ